MSGILMFACTPEEPGDADFRARADRICSEADEQIAQLERPENPSRAQPFLKKVDEITREALGKLDEIEPPEEQAERFQNMIDLLKIALFYQPQLREAVRQENPAAAQEMRTKIANTLDDASEIARALDLEVCVGGPEDQP